MRYEPRDISTTDAEPQAMHWQLFKVYDKTEPQFREFPDGERTNGRFFKKDAFDKAEALNIQLGHPPTVESYDDKLKRENAEALAEKYPNGRPDPVASSPFAGAKKAGARY